MYFTKQYKKLRNVYFKVAVAACLFVIFVVPFASKFTYAEEVVQDEVVISTGTTCYSIVLNGVELGVVADRDIAKEALLNTRTRLITEMDSVVYVDTDLDIYTNYDYTGKVISQAKLEEAMYTNLSAVAYIPDDVVYTVRIDDFMVTVGSEEEVVELLEAAKARIEKTDEFQIELVDEAANGFLQKTVNVASADITINEAAKVLATVDGTAKVQVTDDTVFENGVLYVGFEEEIEIIETSSKHATVLSVQEALDLITKEKAEKGIYEVVAGDCLSTIANKTGITLDELYALNEGLTADTVIYAGDRLTITVPKPELSVIVKEEVTYEESYEADIVYVDNNYLYQGTENVISYGTPGYREVIAVVSYSNGTEYEREIINETIITEAVATVVERGTLVPPTFIMPIYSGAPVTSPWGYRTHPITGVTNSLHTGIDWGVPMGTSVKASCGGTVTLAGWNAGYGWCVDISHGNGITTRYGHLNGTFYVTVGQTVTQGQVIALSGNSGNSTGPHLHFEVLVWGTSKNPLDYINK